MRHAAPIAFASVMMLAAIATAAPRPDFTGTWELNLTKSDFAGHTSPHQRTDVIAAGVGGVKIATTVVKEGKPVTNVGHFTLDGRPTKNTVQGRDLNMTGRWVGDTLRVETRTKVFAFDVGEEQRWTLSPDRATLTVRRRSIAPVTGSVQTLVFDRKR